MHDIRRLGLQVFAAPNNLTGEVQIEVKAREIDFVTSFGKNLQALLDILGITRMIRKENNSVLKTKTVKGELQSGDVGEGEEIPMSRYTVEEKPFDTIKIEKYRKGVSLEAISEKGYEAAVQDTDDEFKSDLQNVVTDKFYAQLKAGSLTGYETTWQMAVAMAIGKVVAKFQKMKRTARRNQRKDQLFPYKIFSRRESNLIPDVRNSEYLYWNVCGLYRVGFDRSKQIYLV